MMQKIKLGMLGGGRSSQIGNSHQVAAKRDGLFELVAGSFDHDPKAGVEFGLTLGLNKDRLYDDYQTMLNTELSSSDCIEAVSIMTPNNLHFPMASIFAKNNINVICEKPLTTNLDDALKLYNIAKKTGVVFGVMYGYIGYPMVRQAREMVLSGELGEIHMINTEFAHGHAFKRVEKVKEGAAWRVDPAISGPSFVLADIGTHAFHLGSYVCGCDAVEISANLRSLVKGRTMEDNAYVWINYDNGATGSLWASAVATGNAHGLGFRIFGSKGSIHFSQENPNRLIFKKSANSTKIYERGSEDLHPKARTERVGIGHPEGYFESFSNVYRQFAQAILTRRSGETSEDDYPNIVDGIKGVKFIESCIESNASNHGWVNNELKLEV